MPSNLDRYKKDLGDLLKLGDSLLISLYLEHHPNEFRKFLEGTVKATKAVAGSETGRKVATALKAEAAGDRLSFSLNYQRWYTEAREVVKQILPDRLADFTRHYERPKTTRKDISVSNYTIEDGLQGLRVSLGISKVVGPEAVIPLFQQQLAILKSVERRFDSSLFEIRQLVQADLFDSELDAARELNKNKFTRGAGAVAGVVLEKHLAQVAVNHSVAIAKKDPGINDLSQALRTADVIDVPTWRSIQHLADIRNLCDHNKKVEPTQEQVTDLIAGVDKVIKTIH